MRLAPRLLLPGLNSITGEPVRKASLTLRMNESRRSLRNKIIDTPRNSEKQCVAGGRPVGLIAVGVPAANGLGGIFNGHWERWMAERLPVDSMLDPLDCDAQESRFSG